MRNRTCMIILMCIIGVSLSAIYCMATDYQVTISEYRFFIEKPDKKRLELRVKGKVRNLSSKAVRDVVVGVECSGCANRMTNEKWIDASALSDGNKVRINHLAPNETKSFEMTAAAMISPYWATKKGTGTGLTKDFPRSPSGLMVRIVSFKPAD